MDTGDAGGIQLLLPFPDQLTHIGVVRLGQHVHVEAGGVLPQDTVLKIHQSHHLRLHIFQGTNLLQHHRIAGGNMDAGPQHTHRDVGGDAIHILFCQQSALFHGLLVPAHADEIIGMLLLNPGLTARHHFIDVFNAQQRHIPAEHGVVEQVHMGIVKARQHTGAVKVLFLIPSLGQRLLICPQKHNFPILNTNGLISAHGLIH